MIVRCLLLLLCALAPTLVGAEERPKRIFAHYMACYPVGRGATNYHRNHDAHKLRHDGGGEFAINGGRWRNWPLVPDGAHLSLEESAEMEIRRALRGGLDGFAIDAWAGSFEECTTYIGALFAVAEKHDLPFAITICLDSAGADAISWLLKTHGHSPKLARRDGKPLIFGYNSLFSGIRHAEKVLKDHPDWAGKDIPKSHKLRTTEEGWKLFADGMDEIAKAVGEDIYFHYCLAAYDWWVPAKDVDYPKLGAYMASRGFAVGAFLPVHRTGEIGKAVVAAGGEWAQPMYFQYENIGWGGNRIGPGTAILQGNWQGARDSGSTLIQFVTWNDYTENTNLAPGSDTRYAVLDLNAWFVQWWKTGVKPTPERDKIYLFHRKYQKGATFWPFKPRQPDGAAMLEVTTILTAPGVIRLPGREETYEAPAGLFSKRFPLVTGPVAAELLREGAVVLSLVSPEPVTDRPYREQNSMTAISTEYERHWRADFPEVEPQLQGEYADRDGDGLPDWFEMYWFGKFLDWSTAHSAKPNADPDKDGKTNLEEFHARTDPTMAPVATLLNRNVIAEEAKQGPVPAFELDLDEE